MTSFHINGRAVTVDAEEDTPLLWVIRDVIGLTGTKFGCGIGMCGACTVHVGGRPTRSCITPLASVAGAKLTTIEGLDPESRHPVQKAWADLQVPQCGYCQSGQIMQAASLINDFPSPTDQDIDAVMAGNLCRCMTYVRIRNAVKQAAANHGKLPAMTELKNQSALSRRTFLIGLAGTAVTFGFAPKKASAQQSGSSPFEPTIWYSLDRDGIGTVNIIRAEMGQHIGTAIARVLADELEVDWSNVRILLVDADPKWGYMQTGGSKSVWVDFPIYSRAGAAGRIALIEAGARLLGVSPPQCVARRGAVSAEGRSITYGEIVRRGGRHANLRRTNSRSCRSSRPQNDVLSGKRSTLSMSPARSTARRATASMRSLKVWSMLGRRFLRHVTAQWSARSTIPRRSGSRDISRA